MRNRLVAWIFAGMLAPAVAAAVTVEGVKLEDKVQLSPGGPTLVLNGAGLRSRFVIDVYVAGLYLTEKKSSAADVLALAGPKRVSMTLLRDLSAQTLVDALNEGMEKNTPPAELEKMKGEVGQLTKTMRSIGDAKKGDVVALDYLPESGTRVLLNGQPKGQPIPGEGFYRALLGVWLGDKPAQDSLKKALLGG